MEIEGLPAGGPATLPGVKDWLRITDDDDDERLTAVLDAANRKVRSWPIAYEAVGLEEWPPDIVYGTGQLVAWLWRRKDAPAGTDVISNLTPSFVLRNSPEIAMMLGLNRPALG